SKVGTLATGDCQFGDGSFFDDYSFSGAAGQQIAVEMSSAEFDTYLLLLGPDGSTLKTDDDSGGGTDSYIPSEGGFYALPSTGTYIIRSKAFYANQTGNYSILLTLQSPW